MSPEFDVGRDEPASHTAVGFEFVQGEGRDHWWPLLSERVKQHILEFTGPTIDWWAYTMTGAEGRAYAVLFGERGLVVTQPTTNESGGPTDKLDAWTFVPGPVGSVQVSGHARPVGTGGAPSSAGRAPLEGELNPQMRGFLGNLPPQAQRQLQQPFLARDTVMSSGFHYYGSDAELDAWCYLAGRKSVTFASGRKAPDYQAGGVPTWHLTCWQATVVHN